MYEILHYSYNIIVTYATYNYSSRFITQGDNYQTVSDIPPEKRMVVLFNAVQALANVHRYHWVWRYSSGWEIKMDHQSCEGYWEKMVGALIAVPAHACIKYI